MFYRSVTSYTRLPYNVALKMVWRILILILPCLQWSFQHLTYPIVFCEMAATCIHDGRMVCASSPDGCVRRSFLDQCDMYEYNCDFGTRFQETYSFYCPDYQPSTTNNVHKKEPYTESTSKRIQSPSISCASTTKDTDETTDKMTSDTLPVTETTPGLTPSTTNKRMITSTQLTPFKHETKSSPQDNLYCDRPKTWETTLSDDIIIETPRYSPNFIKSAENEIDLRYPEVISTTHIAIIDPAETSTKKQKIVIEKFINNTHTITNIKPKRYFTQTITKEIKTAMTKNTLTILQIITKKLSAKTSKPKKYLVSTNTKKESTACCNRPITWETTTDAEAVITKYMSPSKDIKEDTDSEFSQSPTKLLLTTKKTIPISSTIEIFTTSTETPVVSDDSRIFFTDNVTSQTSESNTYTAFTQLNITNDFPDTNTNELSHDKLIESSTNISKANSIDECCQRPETWKTTTDTPPEDTTTKSNESDNKMSLEENVIHSKENYVDFNHAVHYKTPADAVTQLILSEKATHSILCDVNGIKCQRPRTWFTTTTKRYRHRYRRYYP